MRVRLAAAKWEARLRSSGVECEGGVINAWPDPSSDAERQHEGGEEDNEDEQDEESGEDKEAEKDEEAGACVPEVGREDEEAKDAEDENESRGNEGCEKDDGSDEDEESEEDKDAEKDEVEACMPEADQVDEEAEEAFMSSTRPPASRRPA